MAPARFVLPFCSPTDEEKVDEQETSEEQDVAITTAAANAAAATATAATSTAAPAPYTPRFLWWTKSRWVWEAIHIRARPPEPSANHT